MSQSGARICCRESVELAKITLYVEEEHTLQ